MELNFAFELSPEIIQRLGNENGDRFNDASSCASTNTEPGAATDVDKGTKADIEPGTNINAGSKGFRSLKTKKRKFRSSITPVWKE